MFIESPVFLCQFCAAALEHNASAVRDLAARVILSMYQQHRAAVLHHLPPNNAVARKNYLFKTLFDGFSKIDGKPVKNLSLTLFHFIDTNFSFFFFQADSNRDSCSTERQRPPLLPLPKQTRPPPSFTHRNKQCMNIFGVQSKQNVAPLPNPLCRHQMLSRTY